MQGMNFTVSHKFIKDGCVVGVACLMQNGDTVFLRKVNFRAFFGKNKCLNAKLSTNDSLLSLSAGIPELELSGNKRVLFHGSKFGIQDGIAPNKSRVACDFGLGFYTGISKNQARERIVDESNGIFYSVYADMSNLDVYTFKNMRDWCFFVGVNHGFIKLRDIPKFEETFNRVKSSDIIVGDIADDIMQSVFSDFLIGNITDIALKKCLICANLGAQYVFKTAEACSSITFLGKECWDERKRLFMKSEQRKSLASFKRKVDIIKQRNRRNGKFIDELKEEYK